MKKLFFTICFFALTTTITSSFAGVQELRNEIELQQYQSISRPVKPLNADDPKIPREKNALEKYIVDRITNAPAMSLNVLERNSTMNAQSSSEYIASQTDAGKSSFQRIYEEALSRIDGANNSSTPIDFITYSLPERASVLAQKKEWAEPDFDVINVTLPNGEKILAPAKEHIPYLLSRIDILPNGLVHIKEVISVIANGEKLKYGLSKALPKYSTSRDGTRNRTIPYLNGVTINGTKVDYELRDAYDRYIITPSKQLPLRPGIYTYEFDYIVDRKLWYYENNNEFYWDVSGSFWNLVIARAIATVRTPVNVEPLGQNMFLGFAPNYLTTAGAAIAKDNGTNVLGFVSTVPLFAGEGMHILVSLPKKGFLEPDFNKKFEWFVEDYGDIIFSFAGFLAILVAYLISWRQINSGTTQNKISVQKNPSMQRVLLKGVFDKISIVSFLLDLYRKGIIDIKEQNEKILLIKKVDDSKKINANEKKSLKQIFTKKETTFVLDANNALKLKRAGKAIEKDTYNRIKLLSFKLNSGYILFSFAMLALSILAMSYISVCSGQTFALIASSTVIAGFYIWLSLIKFKKKWINITVKIISIIIVIGAGLFLSTKIHTISTIFIIAMLYIIFTYTKLFAKRNGLIRANIIEAQTLAKHLKNNAQTIILGHDFKNQQPYIFALDETAAYEKSPIIEDVYKLDLAKKIQNML